MTSAPDSLTPPTTAPDVRDDAGLTPAERLIVALVERGLRARGVPVERSPAAVDAAVARASKALGAEQADALKRAVTGRACGELLDVVATAKGDAGRKLALRAARELASLVAEHQLESASAVALALDAAVWSSRAWAIFAESTSSATPNDEATTRAHDRASARASQSLSAALRVEAEARATRPKAPAFNWPVLVQPDPFPSRPRVPAPAEDDVDEEPEEQAREPVEMGRPHPGVGEDEEPGVPLAQPDPFAAKGSSLGEVDGFSTPLPGGQSLGGRWGRAPSFPIPPTDPVTLRAVPSRRSGPGQAARESMRGRGLEWDDEARQWVQTAVRVNGGSGDE